MIKMQRGLASVCFPATLIAAFFLISAAQAQMSIGTDLEIYPDGENDEPMLTVQNYNNLTDGIADRPYFLVRKDANGEELGNTFGTITDLFRIGKDARITLGTETSVIGRLNLGGNTEKDYHINVADGILHIGRLPGMTSVLDDGIPYNSYIFGHSDSVADRTTSIEIGSRGVQGDARLVFNTETATSDQLDAQIIRYNDADTNEGLLLIENSNVADSTKTADIKVKSPGTVTLEGGNNIVISSGRGKTINLEGGVHLSTFGSGLPNNLLAVDGDGNIVVTDVSGSPEDTTMATRDQTFSGSREHILFPHRIRFIGTDVDNPFGQGDDPDNNGTIHFESYGNKLGLNINYNRGPRYTLEVKGDADFTDEIAVEHLIVGAHRDKQAGGDPVIPSEGGGDVRFAAYGAGNRVLNDAAKEDAYFLTVDAEGHLYERRITGQNGNLASENLIFTEDRIHQLDTEGNSMVAFEGSPAKTWDGWVNQETTDAYALVIMSGLTQSGNRDGNYYTGNRVGINIRKEGSQIALNSDTKRGKNQYNEFLARTFEVNGSMEVTDEVFLSGLSGMGLNGQANLMAVDSITGEVFITGITAQNGMEVSVSDARLKENVEPYTRGLKFISQLNPKQYTFSESSGKGTRALEVGLIAQDVMNLAPESIGDVGIQKDDAQYYGLYYNDFVMALINSTKELDNRNKVLAKRLDKLHEELEVLKASLLIPQE